MKLPTTMDILLEEWTQDAKIDELNIHKELLNIANLKVKYLKILSHHNMKVKILEKEYDKLKRVKWEYYSGDLNNPEDLKQYNLPPWPKKVLRQDLSYYLDSDKDLVDFLLKKTMHSEIVEVCKEIIKELNNRTYQIRGFIDYRKFLEGL